MEVNKLPIFRINNDNNSREREIRFGVSCPNLAPLKQDTVSFKGTVLKKSDFNGTDLAVIEKFKPNIQQFKKKEDLQTFAKNKINELKEKDFDGRQEEAKIQRKAMLKEWFDYVIKENDEYSNTQRLIILSAITKDLHSTNDIMPPVLNRDVLRITIADIESRLKENPKENFDLNKTYQNNLRIAVLENLGRSATMTGWIVIPSISRDAKNFDKNVNTLRVISHDKWCTKFLDAKLYLMEGDLHVYLEKGKPKLGVRFRGDKVGEIQGEKNNGEIPQQYLDTFKSHQKEYNIQLKDNAQQQLDNAEIVRSKLQKLKQELGTAIELKTINDAVKIFDYIGIETQNKDYKLTISTYKQPDGPFSFYDLSIDENKLMSYVSEISEDVNFGDSKITNLGQLQNIGGKPEFKNSQITSLAKLKTIGGDVSFANTKITDLGELQIIKSSVSFENSQIKNVGKLNYIGGCVLVNSSTALKKEDFKNIKIGGSIIKL